MHQLLAIIKKELKAAFYSPAALLFLLLFLLINLFSLFYVENFFSRGLCDLKPFFHQMPLLLIFLAAAFTMRLWAEESQCGTLDLLQTLPVDPLKLVLGKFFAGWGLVLVAIICTLPLPLMVSRIGNLDFGPVIGGYLALLCLGGAYLAMGLFCSAISKSQLVALLGATACGLVFWLPGQIPTYFALSPTADNLFLAIGTGSRFNSMLRGLLDIRDLFYYLSLTAIFLALNVFVLQKRKWDKNPAVRASHREKTVFVVLLAANIVLANILLYPQKGWRFDLTQWQEYSISPTTKKLLSTAEEPLLIRGYFSRKTHPLLEPLLSQLQDFLTELSVIAPQNLTIEFIDPADNPAWEEEAQSRFGIRTMPFRFASKHSDSVVNAYFHLLIRYGSNYEVLDFGQLVQIDTQGPEMVASLNNLEYQLARAIKKAIYGFSSLEAICSRLEEPVNMTLFASMDQLPGNLGRLAKMDQEVAMEMVKRCGAPLSFAAVNPHDPESGISPHNLYETYGLRPLTLSAYDTQNFFLHLLVAGDTWQEILTLTDYSSATQLEKELTAILKRHSPGFLKKVAIFAPKDHGQYAREITGEPTYQLLQQKLAENYEVVTMEPPSLKIPGDIEAVIWPRPLNVTTEQAYALDQFIQRGGTLLVGGGSYHFRPIIGEGLRVDLEDSALAPLLAHYGAASAKSVILDRQNSSFPVPVTRKVGDLTLNEMQLAKYPPFVLIKGAGLTKDNPATNSLNQVIMPWSSPVGCQQPAAGQEVTCELLLASSNQSWEQDDFNPNPDFAKYPEWGFAQNSPPGPLPMAISLYGSFTSYFTPEEAPASFLAKSARPGRIIVFGSSAFIEDIVLAITKETAAGYQANLQLVKNLLDWSQEDTDLLTISSHQHYARLLPPLPDDAKIIFEINQFTSASLLTICLGFYFWLRRRRQVPFLTKPEQDHE